MKYYRIDHSFDSKVVGCYPQSTQMGCGYDHSRSDSIDNVYPNEIPLFTPATGCFVLEKRAKLTDFVSTAILPTGFIVSEKAKSVMEQFSLGKHAFFSSRVSYRDKLYDNYYWFIFEPLDLSVYIDYKSTEIYLTDFNGNKIRRLDINNANELNNTVQIVREETNGGKKVQSSVFFLRKDFPQNIDLIKLPISPYDILISERLKLQLENDGITGIRLKEMDWFRF